MTSPDAPRSIEFLGADASEFVPHLAVDCVVLGVHRGELRILLTHWARRRRWSLPGGFVRRDESVDDAAARVLRLRTGLEDVWLLQYHTFGGLDRMAHRDREEERSLPASVAAAWQKERVVSVGYLALVDHSRATPTPDGVLADDCKWWDLRARPTLLFDHDRMVERAVDAVRERIRHGALWPALFPGTFTLPELQRIHEALLGRALDRRNFQKRMLALGVLERVGEHRGDGVRRAPYLYRFVR